MNDVVTQPSNPETPSAQVDVEGLVKFYVELRDAKAALTDKLKEELKPYNEGMEKLETILLKHMQDTSSKSIATEAGTVYQRVERSATIKDKKLFSEYVIANQLFDLLDWKANKVQVFDMIEKTQQDVPGVNTQAFMTVGIRRSTQE
jgi:hypothetical protein